MYEPLQQAITNGFRIWLQSHDVDANELDRTQVRLYLDAYEQERYERQMAQSVSCYPSPLSIH